MKDRQVLAVARVQRRKGIAGRVALDEPVVMDRGEPGADGADQAGDAGVTAAGV